MASYNDRGLLIAESLAPGEMWIGGFEAPAKVFILYRCGKCKQLGEGIADVEGIPEIRPEYTWDCDRCGAFCHTVGDN